MFALLFVLARLGQEVQVNPSDGGPGTQALQTLLDWLGGYSLMACLAAVLAGGGLYAYSRSRGSHGMAITGTALAAGGAVGTILVGLAPAIINSLYNIT